MSSQDFRIVTSEWELLLPDPLPSDWDSRKREFLHSLEPAHHFPTCKGKRADFDAALIDAAVSLRSDRSHFYCVVDGPEAMVALLAIDDDWWVVEYTASGCRSYGAFETAPHPSAMVGFQERGHGSVYPIAAATSLDRNTAIALAARVATGEDNVPFVEVPTFTPRDHSAFDAVDLDFLG